MSLKATQWVIYEVAEHLDNSEYRILNVMADIADPDGRRIFPSINSLAEWAHLSRRTVIDKLKHLETMGVIQRDPDQSPAAGIPANRRPVVYRLNYAFTTPNTTPEPWGAKSAPLSEEPTEVQTEVQTGVQNTPRGAAGVHSAVQTGVQPVCTQTELRIKHITRESTRTRENQPTTTDLDQWTPSPDTVALAGQLDADLAGEAAKFRDHCRSGGHTPADLDAAFRNWLRRGHQHGYNQPARPRTTAGRAQPDHYKPQAHVHTAYCDHVRTLMTNIEHMFDRTVKDGQWGSSDYDWAAQAAADALNQQATPEQALDAALATRKEPA